LALSATPMFFLFIAYLIDRPMDSWTWDIF
jgi:hypothetical protein